MNALDLFRKEIHARFVRLRKKSPELTQQKWCKRSDIHYTTLSSVLSGKRTVTHSWYRKNCQKLGLSPAATKKIVEKAELEKGLWRILAKRERNPASTEARTRIVSDPDYSTLVQALTLDGCDGHPKSISEKTGIEIDRVRQMLNDLKNCGTVAETSNGAYIRLNPNWYLLTARKCPKDLDVQIAKNYRKRISKKIAESYRVNPKETATSTFKCDPEFIDEFRKEIRSFIQRIDKIQRRSPSNKKIFHLNVSLFPASK